MADIKNSAWVQKYRPKKFENLMLTTSLRERFKECVIDNNLIIHGGYGGGKSSLVQILTKDTTMLTINGSSQNKIDDVRNIIEPFCQTSSIASKGKKVVWIDEGDKLTIDAQKALKHIQEKYENNVWFIITTNHPEKLTELYSRMPRIDFTPKTTEEVNDLKRQYLIRCKQILTAEGFDIELEAIKLIVEKSFPDFRSITASMYEASKLARDTKLITLDMVQKSSVKVDEGLFNTIITEYREEQLFSYCKSNYSGRELEALKSLGEPFLDFLYSREEPKYKAKVINSAIIAQKYNYEAQHNVDPFITLVACVGALSNLFKN